MKKTLILITAVLFAASLLSATTVSAQANCTKKMQRFEGPENLHRNIDAFVIAQSFKPAKNYTLCKVRVHLDCGSTCDVTLYVQDGPDATSAVLSQVQATVVGGSHLWYTFDIPDIEVTKDVDYYIRVDNEGISNEIMWGAYTGAEDKYTRGQAYVNGTAGNSDHLFITYTYPPSDPYFAESAVAIDMSSSSAIAPNTITTLTASGVTFDLYRGIDMASVTLNLCTLVVEIADSISGYSEFAIKNVGGQFDAYIFAGEEVGVSTISSGSGVGSIEWATGEIIYSADVKVDAAGFLPVNASINGSAVKTSDFGVQMKVDGQAVETGRLVFIPSLTTYGIIVLVVLLLISAWWVWRKKKQAVIN